MMDDETMKTFYMLYKSWCKEMDLDPKDEANRDDFFERVFPS